MTDGRPYSVSRFRQPSARLLFHCYRIPVLRSNPSYSRDQDTNPPQTPKINSKSTFRAQLDGDIEISNESRLLRLSCERWEDIWGLDLQVTTLYLTLADDGVWSDNIALYIYICHQGVAWLPQPWRPANFKQYRGGTTILARLNFPGIWKPSKCLSAAFESIVACLNVSFDLINLYHSAWTRSEICTSATPPATLCRLLETFDTTGQTLGRS